MRQPVFKALSDPTRREILRILAGGEQSAGMLAERFDMTKPTVSHHFAVLREAGLIRSRREGQSIIYALDTTVVQDLLTWVVDLLGVNGPEDSHVSPLLGGGDRPGRPDVDRQRDPVPPAAGPDPDPLEPAR